MDARIIMLLALGVFGILLLFSFFGKAFKKKGFMRGAVGVIGLVLVAYSLVGAGAQLGWYELGGSSEFFLSAAVASGVDDTGIVCPSGSDLIGGACVTAGQPNFQPTGSYTARDKFAATTTISGTSYYKVGSNSATTTAASNLNKGQTATYWVDNSTYWVKPDTRTAGEGVTQFEALGWNNASATVSLYDNVGRQSVTTGAANVSMGANDNANIEITYQGTAEKSSGPFGGIMVVSYNSSMASVLCTGEQLLDRNPYHLTFTTTTTSHTFKQFPYSSAMDDGSGAVRRVDCQFKNGAVAAGAGSSYIVDFIPANYYVTDSGDIVLDVEKSANGDTTRTGSVINLPTATGNWAA